MGANGADGRLGDVLASENHISEAELDVGLRHQREYRGIDIPCRLGEVLVDSGICSASVVSKALHAQRDRQVKGNSIGQILVELGFATEDEIHLAMETHTDVLAPLGEVLLEKEVCTEDQIRNRPQDQQQYDASSCEADHLR